MKPLFALGLLGTLVLGALLRWQLAGAPLSWTFAHARHAHSHLAFYGLLFPLVWAAWRALGARVPGRKVLFAYAGFVALATVGFLSGGYWAPSHAGSGGVLAIWLYAAWLNRDRVSLTARDYLAPGPLALVIAAACVPFIAILTPRDYTLAANVVRTFLSLLVYGVLMPGALARVKVPAPPAGVWLGLSLLAAAFTGLFPDARVLGLGLALLGAVVLVEIARVPGALGLHRLALWAVGTLGMIAIGTGALDTPMGSIAGLHFLALGPIGVSLLGRRPPLPAWHLGSWSAATAIMSLAILLMGLAPAGIAVWQMLAAASGTVLCALAAAAIGLWKRRRR